jgi:hypothetical protein
MEVTIDELYNAIEEAETGNLNPGMDRYIRTTKENSESSAFGPVQMTKGILSGPGYSDIGFTPEENAFVQEKLIPLADNFLKYGGNDMTPGMERYDYGQGGDFTPSDTTMYKNVAKRLMAYEFGPMRADGDVDTFIQNWRGESEQNDSRYYEAVRSKLPRNSSDRVFNAMVKTTETPALDEIRDTLSK